MSMLSKMLAKNKYYKSKNIMIEIYLLAIGMSFNLSENELFRYRERGVAMNSCGNYIEVLAEKGGDKIQVVNANFCRDRFCFLCNKIKSVKRFNEMSVIVDNLYSDGFIYHNSNKIIAMITLTVRNVGIDELDKTIKDMNVAYKRMFQNKKLKQAVLGYGKSHEILYKSVANEYHPHIHIFCILDESFKLTTKDVQLEWQKALKETYAPQCLITEAYCNGEITDISETKRAIIECLKYNTKTDEETPYSEMPIADFYKYDKALKGKRLVTYGGIIAEYRKKLKFNPTSEEDFNENDIEFNTKTTLNGEIEELIITWADNDYRIQNKEQFFNNK